MASRDQQVASLVPVEGFELVHGRCSRGGVILILILGSQLRVEYHPILIEVELRYRHKPGVCRHLYNYDM